MSWSAVHMLAYLVFTINISLHPESFRLCRWVYLSHRIILQHRYMFFLELYRMSVVLAWIDLVSLLLLSSCKYWFQNMLYQKGAVGKMERPDLVSNSGLTAPANINTSNLLWNSGVFQATQEHALIWEHTVIICILGLLMWWCSIKHFEVSRNGHPSSETATNWSKFCILGDFSHSH